MAALHQAVVNHATAHNWAAGTRVIAASNDLRWPIAMSYLVTKHSTDGGPLETGATPLAGDLNSAILYFARIFGASDKYERPINITLPYSTPTYQISESIESQLQYQQTLGMNPFEWVQGEPYVNEYGYYDTVHGIEVSIFVGAIWQVNFPGGYSAQYQFQGATKGVCCRWTLVPNSLRLNGKLVSSATPAKPIANWNYSQSSAVSYYYGNTNPTTTLSLTLDPNFTEVKGTVTVGEPCDCGGSTNGETVGDEL